MASIAPARAFKAENRIAISTIIHALASFPARAIKAEAFVALAVAAPGHTIALFPAGAIKAETRMAIFAWQRERDDIDQK